MLALPLLLLMQHADAQAQKNSYACKEADPAALCTVANTCNGFVFCRCEADFKCCVRVSQLSPEPRGIPSFA